MIPLTFVWVWIVAPHLYSRLHLDLFRFRVVITEKPLHYPQVEGNIVSSSLQQMSQIDMPMYYHVCPLGVQCWNAIFLQILRSWRLMLWNDLSQKFIHNAIQLYHFVTDFDRMLLQLVDVLNNLLKYWATADMHHWNVWTVVRRLWKNSYVVCEYSMSNHKSIWKSELKFKLMYLLN